MRFQKRIKIAPGVRLNVSKSGFSTTIGGRGASVNVGKNGVHANAGISGTGISTRKKLGGNASNSSSASSRKTEETKRLGAAGWICALTAIGFFVWLIA